VTDDEIEPKSYSLLSEYFTNEKIEVNKTINWLFEGCIKVWVNCFFKMLILT
jgi:hypothetical protein